MKILLLKLVGGAIFAVGAVWLFNVIGFQPAVAVMLTLLGLSIQYLAREMEIKKRGS
jgi:hypothetical protein